MLVEALAEVSGIAPDVVIEPLVAYGHAADVLVRAAKAVGLTFLIYFLFPCRVIWRTWCWHSGSWTWWC